MTIAPYLREIGRGKDGARSLTREQAADPKVASSELPDDVADGRAIAERHERTEVAVSKRDERASPDARSDRTREQARLLVRRLRT